MPVKVTYVEMLAPPTEAVEPPRHGLSVVHAHRPPLGYYRDLYDAVGAPWGWASRKKKSDDELRSIVHHPAVELHVLHVEGEPAGFAELDRRVEGEVELGQFGLTPDFIGMGLGRYFLSWAVRRAWQGGPRRVWLHTCTNDHPRALPNYHAAGFVTYREEWRD